MDNGRHDVDNGRHGVDNGRHGVDNGRHGVDNRRSAIGMLPVIMARINLDLLDQAAVGHW